jgi:hypothetical protein
MTQVVPLFEISLRAGTFSGVIRFCRAKEQPVSWNEIAKRKREDRARVNTERSLADENRAKLRDQLPAIFDSIVDGICREVDSYNSGKPLESDGISASSDRDTMTARFEKDSSPAAVLALKLSKPANNEHGNYAAILTCETTGFNADQERKTEHGHFEIWMNNLGVRFMRRGRDGAFSDLSGVKGLVDGIITPLVYFVE